MLDAQFSNRTTMHLHRGFCLPILQEACMLETYLTVKNIVLLLSAALMVPYLMFFVIVLFQAVAQRYEAWKMLKDLEHKKPPRE